MSKKSEQANEGYLVPPTPLPTWSSSSHAPLTHIVPQRGDLSVRCKRCGDLIIVPNSDSSTTGDSTKKNNLTQQRQRDVYNLACMKCLSVFPYPAREVFRL